MNTDKNGLEFRGVQMGQRTAIHCRVSTGDQSCDRQERDLGAFAERGGYEVVGVFKEKVRLREVRSGSDNSTRSTSSPQEGGLRALRQSSRLQPPHGDEVVLDRAHPSVRAGHFGHLTLRGA